MARRQIVFISVEEIQNLHEELLARDGGLPGLRAGTSLSSVLQRVENNAVFDTYQDPKQLAALATFAIVAGHPFNDGNKRTALVAGVALLKLNKCPQPSPPRVAELIPEAATGNMGQEEFVKQYVDLLQAFKTA